MADAFQTPGRPRLTAEERLRNVARVAIEHTEVVRSNNGRGRRKTYAADADAIAETARQLAGMVLAHLDGELGSVETGSPF